MVYALDIDLEKVRDAELVEQIGEGDAAHADFLAAAGVAPGPAGVQAAPMVIVQIDVEDGFPGALPDRRIDDLQMSIIDLSPKSRLRHFAKRRIGFERDDIEPAAQIKS